MDWEPKVVGTAALPAARSDLAAEDRIVRVADASPTALVLTGRSGRIEMVNRQAERMFGYDRAELRDAPLELLMPERFRGRHVHLQQDFLANMSTRMTGEGQELFGLRKDGTEFPAEIGLNPIDLGGGSMMLAGIVDITARRRIERDREQKGRELERSNADLEEFAYAASHDLKAPLRAIAHLVQWISDDIGATASDDTVGNLKLLAGRVIRLRMLLDGLIAYARAGATPATAEDVDIAELVRDVVMTAPPPPGIVVTCEGTMPRLHTHRIPIRVVLENLIGNAVQHHDRAEGRVTVAMSLADGVAEFRVGDDGPGIPSRFHERIFVIFQTLASRDDVELSGMGLAIVKKKILSNGGHIRVESASPVRGTTFIFSWNEAPQ